MVCYENLDGEESMRTIINNATINNNYLYVFLRDINMLCSINLLSNEIKLLGSIPGESFLSKYLVGKMFVYDDVLYFVPHNAKKAWKYNIETSSWSIWFEIGECIIDNRVVTGAELQQKFNQAYLYDEKVCMIGFRYPAIVLVDLKTGEITYDFTVYKELQNIDDSIDTYIRHDGYMKDEVIFLPCMKKNYILKYNLEKQTGFWIEIGDENKKYAGITCINDKYYLATYLDNEYVIWDGKDNYESDKISPNDEEVYFGAFCVNNQVVFPGKENTKTVKIKRDDNSLCYECAYLFYDEIEAGIIIKQNMDGTIYIYNEEKEIVIDFSIDEEIFIYTENIDINKEMSRLNVVSENNIFDLQLYIKLLGV